MDSEFSERSWQSPDGLELYFRDYAGDDSGKVPVVCLHGLTRNSRDFEGLAPHIAALGHRVIVPDMRGRGQSAYADDSATYAVPTYIADVMALLEQEGIDRYVSIGTSMGGLMTMLIAQFAPEKIAGALINDIGPVVDPRGIEKIRTYLGKGGSFPTWMHAARSLEEVHGASHPTFETNDWIAMAKRSMTLCNNGRIAFDYDMKIADPFNDADENAVPPDLWPGFDALADKPLVLVRGEVSEILSAETLSLMQKRAPDADTVIVPKAGHAPTLDEPEVRSAVDALLSSVK
ncbi:alpha/beta hydrolase [Qipengyuania sp. 1NDW9]|uniref:Alpha/beta hydrolase n=2 Tax=Qipengyuania TaxID=1855416 RepID=A0A9Q3S1J4_9SPHN|nr:MULTISPECIES: alpha/beta hydrolase [Qipengyuania]MBX7492581.1 alpha/beta hydrolase [Qipengyuania xiapuensis]MBY6218247.1 alpha/beta hydrolase [Qipengyuania aquimaris]QZD93217.1 alpha/beta hydrolase [Qipengyuania xiapuensis]